MCVAPAVQGRAALVVHIASTHIVLFTAFVSLVSSAQQHSARSLPSSFTHFEELITVRLPPAPGNRLTSRSFVARTIRRSRQTFSVNHRQQCLSAPLPTPVEEDRGCSESFSKHYLTFRERLTFSPLSFSTIFRLVAARQTHLPFTYQRDPIKIFRPYSIIRYRTTLAHNQF